MDRLPRKGDILKLYASGTFLVLTAPVIVSNPIAFFRRWEMEIFFLDDGTTTTSSFSDERSNGHYVLFQLIAEADPE